MAMSALCVCLLLWLAHLLLAQQGFKEEGPFVSYNTLRWIAISTLANQCTACLQMFLGESSLYTGSRNEQPCYECFDSSLLISSMDGFSAVVHHSDVFAPQGFPEAAIQDAPNLLSQLPDSNDPIEGTLGLPEQYKRHAMPMWPRTEILYTDGSARNTGKPDGYRSGAGVFRFESSAGPRLELAIDPIDYHTGVANSIQRAELVAIYKALQVQHVGDTFLLCTDSLSSMYMIDKHIRCPGLHKECKHEELLTNIVEQLAEKARNGVWVSFLKVKSHIGVEGNENGLQAAKALFTRTWNSTL